MSVITVILVKWRKFMLNKYYCHRVLTEITGASMYTGWILTIEMAMKQTKIWKGKCLKGFVTSDNDKVHQKTLTMQ